MQDDVQCHVSQTIIYPICKRPFRVRRVFHFLIVPAFFAFSMGCQSAYEQFQKQAPNAEKVVISFYKDTARQIEYEGLSIKAEKPGRIREIAGFVKDSFTETTSCTPLGHIEFRNAKDQLTYDLPFCLTNQQCLVKVTSETFYYVNKEGKALLDKHYQSFREMRR